MALTLVVPGPDAPGADDTPALRGQRSAEAGRWAEAAAAFEQAVAREPDDAESWSRLAIARLATNDRAAYRRACAGMLERFAGTKDPRAASLLAYTCVAEADAVADWSPVVRVAERAVPLFRGNERVLGAALYRAGRFAESIERLDSASRVSPPVGWDWLFLSMAHHRLGHADRAREYLGRAERWIAGAEQPLPRRGEPPRTGWYNWSERVELTRSLLPEAKTLLESEAPRGSKSSARGSCCRPRWRSGLPPRGTAVLVGVAAVE